MSTFCAWKYCLLCGQRVNHGSLSPNISTINSVPPWMYKPFVKEQLELTVEQK